MNCFLCGLQLFNRLFNRRFRGQPQIGMNFREQILVIFINDPSKSFLKRFRNVSKQEVQRDSQFFRSSFQRIAHLHHPFAPKRPY